MALSTLNRRKRCIKIKLAILYICTGRFSIFWEGFYSSCCRFFLQGKEKDFFVFTDADIPYKNETNVHVVEQKKLGWPYDTLFRFHMFERVIKKLKKFDFLIFFNANMLFIEDIDDSFLPSEEEGILLQQHPGYFNKCRFRLPYERRRKSKAYVPYWRKGDYVCGGSNGGYTENYLKMISALRQNIDQDERNHIMAKWHDESHLNRYVMDINYKLLHPGYIYPDSWNLPFDKKIRLLDKRQFGGHNFLRGEDKCLPT